MRQQRNIFYYHIIRNSIIDKCIYYRYLQVPKFNNFNNINNYNFNNFMLYLFEIKNNIFYRQKKVGNFNSGELLSLVSKVK